jgi:hypothetical protein
MSAIGLEPAACGHVLRPGVEENPMRPGDSKTFRSDWRFFTAIVICLAILVAVAAALRADQTSALLHLPGSLADGKSVANAASGK